MSAAPVMALSLLSAQSVLFSEAVAAAVVLVSTAADVASKEGLNRNAWGLRSRVCRVYECRLFFFFFVAIFYGVCV